MSIYILAREFLCLVPSSKQLSNVDKLEATVSGPKRVKKKPGCHFFANALFSMSLHWELEMDLEDPSLHRH